MPVIPVICRFLTGKNRHASAAPVVAVSAAICREFTGFDVSFAIVPF
jgi:hypothetical protein